MGLKRDLRLPVLLFLVTSISVDVALAAGFVHLVSRPGREPMLQFVQRVRVICNFHHCLFPKDPRPRVEEVILISLGAECSDSGCVTRRTCCRARIGFDLVLRRTTPSVLFGMSVSLVIPGGRLAGALSWRTHSAVPPPLRPHPGPRLALLPLLHGAHLAAARHLRDVLNEYSVNYQL